MRKMTLMLIICAFCASMSAPPVSYVVVMQSEAINPFKQLIEAVVEVESHGNVFAYNPDENAAGPFQIRPVRLNDFNKRTGNSYKLSDRFNYEISEQIFLYYASQIGPYELDRVAKSWNGSGPMTIDYWKRVQKFL